MKNSFQILDRQLEGSIKWDALSKALYATDASVYKKLPLAVSFPKSKSDVKKIIHFAQEHQVGLIPRTAGTSLAGQCVGNGIVVDVSKHFSEILALDKKNKTVTVQPGVIRDELNHYLQPFGLFFGPNTSTSNRCMIGGMVGNNSSGTTSIQYGVTRDKVISLDAILSDGSEVVFSELTSDALEAKQQLSTLEGKIYRDLLTKLSDTNIQNEINKEFPKPSIHRRNTGYAVDELIKRAPIFDKGPLFSLCPLLTGSEGTLAFTTSITLQLDELPPPHRKMVVAHFDSIKSCLSTVAPVMKHSLQTCEMMDKTILDCTLNNKQQLANRFFVKGDPKALLLLEVAAATPERLDEDVNSVLKTLTNLKTSYAMPVLSGSQIGQAMELRKAGLGLLGNMVGDQKAVACIEDTAVSLADLDSFIDAFSKLMEKFNQKAVYYAHAGAGELHLRPILNLKDKKDVVLFRQITTEVAQLVKKFKGSLSGEHGDGIVRSEFIPMMVGAKNYELLKSIKRVFDPKNIFNPGKIIEAPQMDESFRAPIGQKTPEIDTLLDFSNSMGIVRATEQCNGSGDCLKISGGTMCPSYRATRSEKDTTRGRANALREFLYQKNTNRFNHRELKEVFDLCLSCKACASECPSNVDVASFKAEFLYQYYQSNRRRLRDYIVGFNARFNALGSAFPSLTNFFFSNNATRNLIKKSLGIHSKRSLPLISNKTLENILQKLEKQEFKYNKKVYLFIDEFTNYLESDLGRKAFQLLTRLGYKVCHLSFVDSGRSQLSKGFLKDAKKLANTNVNRFKDLIDSDTPLIGIEPSSILSFRDEYPKLASDQKAAKQLAKNTYLIDEFIASEIKSGRITESSFTKTPKKISFHAHCHQKALGNPNDTLTILNVPTHYEATQIPSGCCGMAGSFGYEKEHYDISMQIGEDVLFPAVKQLTDSTVIVANGTSCRHQIKDGTHKKALHPVEILFDALL
jgi:FAD/FMN-containing dehydrogenase/Fe-S oxidoreductase